MNPRAIVRIVLGGLLALGGAAGLVTLVSLSYGPPDWRGWAVVHLGIPLTLILSSAFQLLILVGFWLVWRGLSRAQR